MPFDRSIPTFRCWFTRFLTPRWLESSSRKRRIVWDIYKGNMNMLSIYYVACCVCKIPQRRSTDRVQIIHGEPATTTTHRVTSLYSTSGWGAQQIVQAHTHQQGKNTPAGKTLRVVWLPGASEGWVWASSIVQLYQPDITSELFKKSAFFRYPPPT